MNFSSTAGWAQGSTSGVLRDAVMWQKRLPSNPWTKVGFFGSKIAFYECLTYFTVKHHMGEHESDVTVLSVKLDDYISLYVPNHIRRFMKKGLKKFRELLLWHFMIAPVCLNIKFIQFECWSWFGPLSAEWFIWFVMTVIFVGGDIVSHLWYIRWVVFWLKGMLEVATFWDVMLCLTRMKCSVWLSVIFEKST